MKIWFLIEFENACLLEPNRCGTLASGPRRTRGKVHYRGGDQGLVTTSASHFVTDVLFFVSANTLIKVVATAVCIVFATLFRSSMVEKGRIWCCVKRQEAWT